MLTLGERSTRFLRIALAVFDLAGALVIASAVFLGLPTRWWLVDTGAVLVVVSLLVMATAQFTTHRAVRLAARVAGLLTLALGLSFIAALAASFSYLAAIYTPVGRGGALICALAAALAVPYLVMLPAVQLLGFGRRDSGDAPRA
jgi:hypothetical protein